MGLDCMNALAVFTGPGGMWREHEVLLEVFRELGPRPRRTCVLGVVLSSARTVARRDGLPWPTLDETLERMLTEEGRAA